jgi:hypothetical protein
MGYSRQAVRLFTAIHQRARQDHPEETEVEPEPKWEELTDTAPFQWSFWAWKIVTEGPGFDVALKELKEYTHRYWPGAAFIEMAAGVPEWRPVYAAASTFITFCLSTTITEAWLVWSICLLESLRELGSQPGAIAEGARALAMLRSFRGHKAPRKDWLHLANSIDRSGFDLEGERRSRSRVIHSPHKDRGITRILQHLRGGLEAHLLHRRIEDESEFGLVDRLALAVVESYEEVVAEHGVASRGFPTWEQFWTNVSDRIRDRLRPSGPR